MDNFTKYALEQGGDIQPLLIPAHEHQGLGLMNPSIFNHNGKILVILRSTNYTFYHSERKLFHHPYGPLTYLHPENDINLKTWNYWLELDDNLQVTRYNKIDTSKLDVKPLWEFHGLEDARLVHWDNKFYISGVRRDTTVNGQGRMELSELEITPNTVKEVNRYRIPCPLDPPGEFTQDIYCEKNWMPIVNKPFHYVKWTNPTEMVKVDMAANKTTTIHQEETAKMRDFPRGGSQVLPWKDGYIAITHEVDLTKHETGRKDAVYTHRFVIWDKNFNVVKCSEQFSIMNGLVEFSAGMCEYKDDTMLITFGFLDNSAFVLRCTKQAIDRFIEGAI